MKTQAVLQPGRLTPTLQESERWGHTAVHPVVQDVKPAAEKLTRLNTDQNFSSVPVNGNSQTETACPFSPRTCPFGGACHTCPVHVQPKLKISQPDDEYEQEADRVADAVMRMPEPKDVEQEECPASGCAPVIQRRATGRETPEEVPPIVQEVLRSPGRPLESGTRAFMEPRFGRDFSRVRVHTDTKAAESAQAVKAQAYTVGWHIVFDKARYVPTTLPGSLLLAHELTHVLQQAYDSNASPSRLSMAKQDAIGEAKANRNARNLLHIGSSFDVHPRPVALQRAKDDFCLPLSDLSRILLIPNLEKIQQAVSTAAELRITQNYCQKMGCKPIVTDYFDNPIAYSYLSFLIDHNPHLQTNPQIGGAFLLDLQKGVKRPDILTHKSDRKEYYEIKPGSVAGIQAGIEKLHEIQAFMEVYKLPYEAGTVYKPDPEKLISRTTKVGPAKITVSLRARRIAPGLIVYDFCFEGDVDWSKFIIPVLLAALAALLIILTEGAASPIVIPLLASKTPQEQQINEPKGPTIIAKLV